MAVPDQALVAEKAANELHQKVYGTPEGTPDNPDAISGEAPDIKPEDIPQDPAADPNSDTWKHKFHVLQGKYNAEVKADVKELTSQVESLTERNQSLETQINNLSAIANENQQLKEQLNSLQLQVEELKKAPAPANEPGSTDKIGDDLMTSEEREYLEEELDGKTTSIIANIVQRALNKAETKVDAVSEKVESNEKLAAKAVLNSYQKTVIDGIGGQKEFDRLNNHPRFSKEWLTEKIPYSDKTRQDKLNQYHQEGNAAMVIQMFKDFRAFLGDDGKKKDPNGEPFDPPPKEDLVDPTGDAVSGEGDHTSKDLITQAQMNAAYLKAAKDPMGYGQSNEYKDLEKRFFEQMKPKG